MDSILVSAIVTITATLVFAIVGYLLMQRDEQRKEDIEKLEKVIKDTTALVLTEKERTAALVLSESRLNTSLVLSERDKLASEFKTEYKNLDKEFTEFRIKIAEDYATTKMVKDILMQFTVPITKELDDIKVLLGNKLDRRDFERLEAEQHRQRDISESSQ